MAISLLRGILNSEDWDLNPLLIANEYLNWYYSRPFDIEMTTDSGIKWIEQYLDKYPNGNHFDKLIYKVAQVNKGSQSNGWLMRATPLSVYWYKLSDSKIYEFTKRDVTLIHSHPTAIQSVVCYNIAIAHLLNNIGDAEGAIDRVSKYIEIIESEDWSNLKDIWKQTLEAESPTDLITAKEKIGFVLIAFSYAFFYLKNDYTYEAAIRDMLLRGGDTDTNAAIVGGLLGARWGLEAIPKEWVESLSFDNKRKEFVRYANVAELEKDIELLISKADF